MRGLCEDPEFVLVAVKFQTLTDAFEVFVPALCVVREESGVCCLRLIVGDETRRAKKKRKELRRREEEEQLLVFGWLIS